MSILWIGFVSKGQLESKLLGVERNRPLYVLVPRIGCVSLNTAETQIANTRWVSSTSTVSRPNAEVGIKFGRKRKLSDYQRAEAIKCRAAGETLASIAKSYGVHLRWASSRSLKR